MYRFLQWVVLLLLFAGAAAAADPIESPQECRFCGMDRGAYAYSRVVIVYANGTSDGACSLHCAVEQMKKYPARQVKELQVADYGTRKLIDATKAFWVVGGSKPGVMTPQPKWAFFAKADAESFVRKNGGRVTDFKEALDLALKELE